MTPAKRRAITGSIYGIGAALLPRRAPHFYSAPHRVRTNALDYWRDGFRGRDSHDDIQILLDEMVGLGVLRVTAGRCYTLRSPNVSLLFGTEDEILGVLYRQRPKPIEPDYNMFRSALRGVQADNGGLDPRRSPLTKQQVSELIRSSGVTIAFGCPAAGLNDLLLFLGNSLTAGRVVGFSSLIDNEQLKADLAEEIRNRETGGATLICLMPTTGWDADTVRLAAKQVGNLTSKLSLVRCLFVADPAAAWNLAASAPDTQKLLTESNVQLLSLKPWDESALRQWLADAGFSPNEPEVNRIIELTGCWPFELMKLAALAPSTVEQWPRIVEELTAWQRSPQGLESACNDFGFSACPKAMSVLADLAEFQGDESGVSAENLLDVTDEQETLVMQTLRWGDWLRLVSPSVSNEWRIDPLVGRVLLALRYGKSG